MKVTSVSKFRKEIKRYVDEVNQDQEPLILTRSDGVSVVVTSLGAYNSYSETDYLLKSPANARRLEGSLRKAQAGAVKRRKLTKD